MKVCIFIIFYIFTGLFYVLAKDNQIDNIVAVVNDQIILNSDVNKILSLVKKENKNVKTSFNKNFLKYKVLQKLIVDSLILQEANRMNITITENQINTVIKNIALQKNISFNQLKNDILSHDFNNHLDHDNYIDDIERLLKIKMTAHYELQNRIKISEQEVNLVLNQLLKNNKKFYKINLSYILLPYLQKDSNTMISNRKKIAERMVNELQQGYDFEELLLKCKKNKKDFLVKKMFWMRYEDVQKNFSKTLNIFKKGQILGPVLGDKGFYILKINDFLNNKEQMINEFYVQHCLIKPSIILTDAEAKKNIFNIYTNIKKGMYSFDDAVKRLSDDFDTSNKKGDLGWISQKFFNFNMKKEFLHLNKNEISKPIKSSFGWHIFKLLDKRQTDQFYNFQKKQAYNILLHKKMIIEKNNWIKDLKNNAYIKIMQ